MIFIERQETDPYFNIAAEEYIFRQFDDGVCTLWINEPSVIIGKHQNAYAEINLDYLKRENIPVIRRISGGGTVYHDPGNLNFTFISSKEGQDLIDYRKQTLPIIQALAGLKIIAQLEQKNSLMVSGLKISGNSEHIYKNKILHHGTLLFDTDLATMEKALNATTDQYSDNGVKSVRNKVTNISGLLAAPMTIGEFREYLKKHLINTTEGITVYQFSKRDISEIKKLVQNKYEQWAWNFGYSPKYKLEKTIEIGSIRIKLMLEASRGIIRYIKFLPESKSLQELESLLLNLPHDEENIRKKLLTINFADYLPGVETGRFIKELF